MRVDDSANYYKAPSLVTDPSQFDYYLGLYRSYAYTGRTETEQGITSNNLHYYVVGVRICVSYLFVIYTEILYPLAV